MKNLLFLSFALIPLLASAQGNAVFEAGAATSNITPPLGMTIVGNFAPRPISKNVHDELHVRCLALDDGRTKLVFAVEDNLHLGRDIWDEATFKDTFTIELATGSNGYLPTPRQHDLGGYETWLGTNRVEREASVKITAKALELLQSLHTAP